MNKSEIEHANEVTDNKPIEWSCAGTINGSWCNYLMSDVEMQAHKFDLGCPRCGGKFACFTMKIVEGK